MRENTLQAFFPAIWSTESKEYCERMQQSYQVTLAFIKNLMNLSFNSFVQFEQQYSLFNFILSQKTFYKN